MNPYRRARRWLAQLHGPRRTLLPWVHRLPDHGSVVFGMRGVAADEQGPGRLRLGDDVVIHDDVQFHLGAQGRVEIGDGTVIGGHTVIAADRLVRIGARCRVGRYAAITDTWTYGRHVPDGPEPEPVHVGDGVRIGPNSVVGPGVSLPAGAAVGPGASVHREPGGAR